jgi:hypothetical protein
MPLILHFSLTDTLVDKSPFSSLPNKFSSKIEMNLYLREKIKQPFNLLHSFSKGFYQMI